MSYIVNNIDIIRDELAVNIMDQVNLWVKIHLYHDCGLKDIEEMTNEEISTWCNDNEIRVDSLLSMKDAGPGRKLTYTLIKGGTSLGSIVFNTIGSTSRPREGDGK